MSEGARLEGVRAALYPRSIAILGASRSPEKRGNRVLHALEDAGFAGAVYPVNPSTDEIDGFRCYPSVESLPEAPDLALVALPGAQAPEAIRACGRKGVRAAIILAVGFAESGEDGAGLQASLIEAAHESGVRIVGPNTSGLLNLRLGLNLVGAPNLIPGPIGILSQSGNVALALMNAGANTPGAGISVYVGVGNESDIGFHEYLEVLGHDEGTEVVVMYADGTRATGAFLEAAARVTPHKPVVMLKGGRSPSGSTAVLSHTGALAGDYAVLSAALKQAGVVEVTREDELLPVALTLAHQPCAAAGGIAILSDGGGQNALACDLFDDMDCPIAVLQPGTQEQLRHLLGPAAAVRNPVDVAGAADSDPSVFAKATRILVDDPGVAGVLVVGLFGGYHLRFSKTFEGVEMDAVESILRDSAAAQKPVVVHSMYAHAVSAPLDRLREGGVPVTPSLEIACRCSEVSVRRRDFASRRPTWTPGDLADASEGEGGDSGGDAPVVTPVALTEWQVRSELAGQGVAFADGVLARRAEDLRDLNWDVPVAMKIVSEGIPHKTEANGVLLNVESLAEAEAGFGRLIASAEAFLRAHDREVAIDGVLVSEMLPPPIAELLIGVRRVPRVGCVLTVGAGGTGTEHLGDVANRVLPVPTDEIMGMLDELRMAPVLAGARGRPPVDRNVIAELAAALGRFVLSDSSIAELELNPVFVYPERAVAADALMVRRAFRVADAVS